MKENNKNQETVLTANNIFKIYHRGTEEIFAVNDISLEIKRGEFVSFIGPSGSGKTSLINILGCLDNPSFGYLNVAGREIYQHKKPEKGINGTTVKANIISEKKLTLIRREHFGYIFQQFYLIPTLTVYENIAVPLTFYSKESKPDIIGLLASLGIEKRKDHLPGQLSGGEMQRVAIARALVNKPEILLADEPTGNLDSKRSDEIGQLLVDLNKKQGITILMVTHNPALAEMASRTIRLKDGKLDS